MPVKKLGLSFCLNKKTSLLHNNKPAFKKEDVSKCHVLSDSDFMAIQPRFSDDFKRLVYIASETKFLSHSSNYKLKSIDWTAIESASTLNTDCFNSYPTDSDEFAGLYGHQWVFNKCNFMGSSGRFFLVASEFKG